MMMSFLNALTRTKPIPKMETGKGLKRTLSAKDLVVFGISAMVGTGIFVLTGQAASMEAGPALVISILLTGILCGFCALAYSELSALIPVSGSAYAYMFTGMGEFAAWIVGWILVVEYLAGNMAIAQGWGKTVQYGADLVHMGIPRVINTSTFTVLEHGQSIPQSELHLATKQIPFFLPGSSEAFTLVINKSFDFLPFVALLVCAYLLCRGVEENAKIATVMVYIKLSIIVFLIIAGTWYLIANPHLIQQNWFGNGWQTFMPFGKQGIVAGAGLMFFAYVGFDALACSAEEAIDPQKDMPIGIIGSLIICTVLYLLVTVMVTAIVPLNEISRNASVVHTMNVIGIPYADVLVAIGEIVGISSVMLVMQMATVRVVFAIARDRLLPSFLKNVDPKYGVPLIATWVVGMLGAIGSGIMPISLVAEISSLGTLFIFMMVCVAVIVLRYTMPDAPRPFKVPYGITFPLIGALGCIFLMMAMSPTAWFLILVATGVGLAIYFSYGMKNSIMNNPIAAAELPIIEEPRGH